MTEKIYWVNEEGIRQIKEFLGKYFEIPVSNPGTLRLWAMDAEENKAAGLQPTIGIPASLSITGTEETLTITDAGIEEVIII